MTMLILLIINYDTIEGSEIFDDITQSMMATTWNSHWTVIKMTIATQVCSIASSDNKVLYHYTAKVGPCSLTHGIEHACT